MKLCYLDTETTGLDPKYHTIIQLAAMVEIDGVLMKETFNAKCKPIDGAAIDLSALAVTSTTLDELKTREPPIQTLSRFLDFLRQFDTKPWKFLLVGYNSEFDKNFLIAWFTSLATKYTYSNWFYYYSLDVCNLVRILQTNLGWKIPDVKLGTVAKYLSVPLEAHDALSDIKATQTIYRFLVERMIKGFAPNEIFQN